MSGEGSNDTTVLPPKSEVGSNSAATDASAIAVALKKAQEVLSKQTTDPLSSLPGAELASKPNLIDQISVVPIIPQSKITTPSIAQSTDISALEISPLQNNELNTKDFLKFTPDDWNNYVEQNKLKTIKLGKNTTVFPFPNQGGNYIAVTSDMDIGVIEIKHDDLNILKEALEARLKETEVADPIFDVYRGSRETVQRNDALGSYFLTIVNGNKDSPLITMHPVEPESDNKIISDTLMINKIKSAEETMTPVAASTA